MLPCDEIASLWAYVNPGHPLEGCLIDELGIVRVYIWHIHLSEHEPIEIVLGSPPKTVISALRKTKNLLKNQAGS